MKNKKKVIIRIKDLELFFKVGSKKEERLKKIIDKTGFDLYSGEILALIGESGSGKSVITSTLTGLNSDSQIITQGKIEIFGTDVTNFKEKDWQRTNIRGKFISQVFQNPLSTLNPTIKVGKQINESFIANGIIKNKSRAKTETLKLLESVRIKNPNEVYEMYPHQLSGGMIQRVVIVSILASNAKVIIFDEPTTALDPSIQAEIIEIIRELNQKYKISIIFITHDLGVVASIADRIAIMYAGKVVEIGKNKEILFDPKHPYTWGLISSLPEASSTKKLFHIKGQAPADISGIEGDAFAPRNDYALKIDFVLKPPRYKISNTHYVWSWLYSDNAPKIKPPEAILKRKESNRKTNEKKRK